MKWKVTGSLVEYLMNKMDSLFMFVIPELIVRFKRKLDKLMDEDDKLT